MDNSLNLKILQSYVEIDNLYNQINKSIFDFINKANDLVKVSEDDYQIEKTLKLNKISLKAYILDSPCCVNLSNSNITDYTIDELKIYLAEYERNYNDDTYRYVLAIQLYEAVEAIEKMVDDKIDLEIEKLSEIVQDIGSIKTADKASYEMLYYNSKKQIDKLYKASELDGKSYGILVNILNDIFNFYLNGYPNIPDEYLYHE